MMARTIWAALILLAVSSCDKNDIGKACPQLLAESDKDTTTPSSPTSTTTLEVVGQSTTFPCDDFICIATMGRPGYCSKKCSSDLNCPDGFTCRVVQGIGDFAGEKFCVWKSCKRAGDCGDANDFCCHTEKDAQPLEELKLCAFADDDICQ